jgi:serine phosphatase RsbU (regulator of sigma subunit)
VLVTEDPSAVDRELAQLRAKAGEQEVEIARLRKEAAEASDELAQLGAEAGESHRRELDLSALVGRLRHEARVHDDVVSRLLERLAANEVELNDLRAVRDALTPPQPPSRPGLELAASFRPATERVSGDFYLVAEGPHHATALVVGDVVGKGIGAARQAAFIRTVFATTAPFSDDPARLLSWANTALIERAEEDRDFATVGCVTFSLRDRVLRWGYAGHPPVLWLDTGEELSGGRAAPLGLSEELAFTAAAHHLTPGTGVLLYTDGVTEARHKGEQFGQARLAQIVRALEGQAPSEIVAAVTTEVRRFGATRLADDLCVVAARVRLQGEDGDDTLTGGMGADAFSGGPGTDTVTDFNAVQGDTKDPTIP